MRRNGWMDGLIRRRWRWNLSQWQDKSGELLFVRRLKETQRILGRNEQVDNWINGLWIK